MHALNLLQYSFTRKWYIFISIMDGHTLDTLPSKAVRHAETTKTEVSQTETTKTEISQKEVSQTRDNQDREYIDSRRDYTDNH